MFKSIVATILAAILVLAVAVPASATTATGPINSVLVAPGTSPDTRNCLFFQINNASTWYAIPNTDALFAEEVSAVMMAYTTGQSIFFTVGSSIGGCSSFSQAYDLIVGTSY